MKTQKPGLFLFLLTTAQVIYVYAVFFRGRIQDVVFIKELERREIDLRNILMEVFIRSNTSSIG